MASATADAMKAAASNENGAMMGFMGMGMAQNQGATVIGAVNQNLANNQTGAYAPNIGTPEPGTLFQNGNATQGTPQPTSVDQPAPVNPAPENDAPVNIPKFCPNCGTPVAGKFCGNCGNKLY